MILSVFLFHHSFFPPTFLHINKHNSFIIRFILSIYHFTIYPITSRISLTNDVTFLAIYSEAQIK